MPSQVLSRTPEASVKGRPLACARVPGAWLAMRSPTMTGASASSDIEGEPVMRREIAARFDLGELVEHLRAHMRQHHAAGVEAGAVGIDLLEAEMGDRSAREPVAFGDEEVRPLGCLDERLGPARVAGIDKR